MVNMNHGMVLRRGFVVGEERRGNKKHTTTTTRDWLTITVCTLLMIVKVRLCCLSCFVWVGLVVFVSEWWWWWWCSRGTDTPTRGAARIATRRRNGNGICTLHYCMVFGGHWQSNRHTGLSCPNPTIRGGGGGLSGLPGSASEGADFHLRLSKWHARMADGRWAVVLSTVWYCAPPTAAVPCFAGRKRGGTQVHPSTTSNGRLQFRQPPACRFDKAILHSGFRARCVSRRTQTAGYGQGVHASGRLHRIHPSACIQFSPGIRAGMQTGCSRRAAADDLPSLSPCLASLPCSCPGLVLLRLHFPADRPTSPPGLVGTGVGGDVFPGLGFLSTGCLAAFAIRYFPGDLLWLDQRYEPTIASVPSAGRPRTKHSHTVLHGTAAIHWICRVGGPRPGGKLISNLLDWRELAARRDESGRAGGFWPLGQEEAEDIAQTWHCAVGPRAGQSALHCSLPHSRWHRASRIPGTRAARFDSPPGFGFWFGPQSHQRKKVRKHQHLAPPSCHILAITAPHLSMYVQIQTASLSRPLPGRNQRMAQVGVRPVVRQQQ